MGACPDEPRDELRETLHELIEHLSEPLSSDAAGELGPAERDIVESVMSDPELCPTRTAALASCLAFLQVAKQGVVPAIEDLEDALPSAEAKCEIADACLNRERLERMRRRQSTAELAASRLPAARARERQAAVAVASRRRSTCATGPTRARAQQRPRGAGRPRGRARSARSTGPPGSDEGEHHRRGYPRSNDADLTAALA